MKIIRVDNFNRESISDVLIAENVSVNYIGKIVDFLNNQDDVDGPDFFRAVEDNYKLYKFEA